MPPVRHPPSDHLERLTGSSEPSGAPPHFEPITATTPSSDHPDDERAEKQRELAETESFLRERARGVFEPYEGECPLPSNEEWARLANPFLVSCRIGWQILRQSKEQLITTVDAALVEGDSFEGSDFVSSTLERLAAASDWFEGLRHVSRAATERLMCAAAAQNLRERGIAFEEGPAVSPLALDAYDEWLHMERRMLTIEKYGMENASEMGRFIPRTAADDFHFPKERGKSWKDLPPPSDRAESVLDLLGIDWRRDGWRNDEAAENAAVAIDSVSALLAERRRTIARVDEGRFGTEAEADALMDRWGACDAAAMTQPATTVAGACASIEWARDELLQFGFDREDPDNGTRLVLSLLDGALNVLRREGGNLDVTTSSQEAA